MAAAGRRPARRRSTSRGAEGKEAAPDAAYMRRPRPSSPSRASLPGTSPGMSAGRRKSRIRGRPTPFVGPPPLPPSAACRHNRPAPPPDPLVAPGRCVVTPPAPIRPASLLAWPSAAPRLLPAHRPGPLPHQLPPRLSGRRRCPAAAPRPPPVRRPCSATTSNPWYTSATPRLSPDHRRGSNSAQAATGGRGGRQHGHANARPCALPVTDDGSGSAEDVWRTGPQAMPSPRSRPCLLTRPACRRRHWHCTAQADGSCCCWWSPGGAEHPPVPAAVQSGMNP